MIIEILSLNISEDGYLHILVMLDHFAKFVVAVLSLDQDGHPGLSSFWLSTEDTFCSKTLF